MTAAPVRLDVAMVARGLARSRAEARALIEAGRVTIDGVVAAKPATAVDAAALIAAPPPSGDVSRGAAKLRAALEAFAIDPRGRVCLDIGASTGGFTQALLARGAARVHAVDVGHGQLHPVLRQDPRVVSLEGRDARSLTRADIAEPPDLLVCDASFIGAVLVLAVPLSLMAARAEAVVLVKPQFEVGRALIGKRGVVRDEAAQRAAVERVTAFLAERGWREIGRIESPIRGGDGNREWLIGAGRG